MVGMGGKVESALPCPNSYGPTDFILADFFVLINMKRHDF